MVIHSDFIRAITSELAQKIKSYAGAMLVDVVYNYQGSEIAVVWSNANTGVTEIYGFPIVDGEAYTEGVNNGNDYSFYKINFIDNVYRQMIQVESNQTGRPPVI
ncbi:TPA: hypothetical protein N3X57_002913 [Klebsiella quasipneumoniae]|nr:hypothetical protein [Klebsiella quasipneumoniae]